MAKRFRNLYIVACRYFNGWQKQRMYDNENELMLALSKAVLEWNDGACFRSRKGAGAGQSQCRDKALVYELQVGLIAL
jgi:hypothetical protein